MRTKLTVESDGGLVQFAESVEYENFSTTMNGEWYESKSVERIDKYSIVIDWAKVETDFVPSFDALEAQSVVLWKVFE